MKYIIIFILITLLSCSNSKKTTFNTNNREDIRKMIRNYDSKKINEDASNFFIDAMILQQQGNWAESLIDLNLALEYDKSAGIYYSLAKAYIELERYELSLKSLEKSLELDNRFLPSLELLVELHIKNSNYNKAIIVYKEILEIDNSFKRKLNFANIMEYYKPKESILIYEELLDENPTNDKIILKLSQLYKATKQNEKYISSLEKLLKTNGSNLKINLELLDIYMENKDYPQAIEMLDRVDKSVSTSDLDKFYGTVGYNMLYDTTFNDKVSINKYLDKIDSRFYFNWQIQLQSAYLSSKIGDSIRTYKLFKKVLKISDTIPDIPISIAIYYLQKVKDSLALEILEETIANFSDDYRFPFFMGIASQSLEKNEKAISSYKKSIELNKEFLDNWVQLGILYDQIGNKDSSDFFYENAIKIDPLNPLVNNNYAYSLSLRGKELAKAKELSETALSMEPNSAAYLDTYAWINYLIGNYSIALEFIEKAIKTGNASSEVYEHYGDILSKLNREKEALEAYNNALKFEPERKSVIDRINKIESK